MSAAAQARPARRSRTLGMRQMGQGVPADQPGVCRQRLEPTDLAGVAPKQTLGVETLAERAQSSGRQSPWHKSRRPVPARCDSRPGGMPKPVRRRRGRGRPRPSNRRRPPSAERRKKAAWRANAEHRARSGRGDPLEFLHPQRGVPRRRDIRCPRPSTWSRRSDRSISGATAPTLRSAK